MMTINSKPYIFFAANNIGEETETKLTENSSAGGSHLDRSIRVGWDSSLVGGVPVDQAEHLSGQVDGEDIVGIREEADTSDDDGANMVPAEGGLVNLGESETTTLVGISNVGIVVVEVVEGSIATSSMCGHSLSIDAELDREGV